MANLIKSLFYLGGFTALGYMLMKVTEPSPEKIAAIRGGKYNDPQSDENRRKTQLIIQKLQEAANISENSLKKKDEPSPKN